MPTLEFKGKQYVYSHHHSVPFRELDVDGTKSLSARGKKPGLEDNLIIHGDNLHALKALMPQYAGKINCIYIDPPYNTGNEGWCYNDNVNSPLMKEWIKKNAPVDKEDLERHDKWLCMMYPRLKLLHELLADDGVILISIDDNEASHFRLIADEILGEQNFIAQLVWEKSRKNDAKFFSIGHEYMFVYARSKSNLVASHTVWREVKPGAKEIWNFYIEKKKEIGGNFRLIEKQLKEWYKALPSEHPSKALSRYKNIDKWGPWRDRDISWPGGGGPTYDVVHPNTKKPCKVPERGWGFASSEAMKNQIDLGLVVFREDHNEPPFRKAHLFPVVEELESESDVIEEDIEIGMQVMPSVFYKQSQVTVKALRNLMGGKIFDNPKDVDILARLLKYVTNKDAIILDSFAGSGTTAHATLALNKEDGGNRKFILVECEDYADTITAERVRRVINGVSTAKDETLKRGLGGSFSFCELGKEISIEKILTGDSLPAYDALAKYVFYTATGKSLDGGVKQKPDYFVGETDLYEVYLVYEPDIAFLRSNDSALNAANLEAIAGRKSRKEHLVFATAKYMGQEELSHQNITFCQLPYAIHRVVGA